MDFDIKTCSLEDLKAFGESLSNLEVSRGLGKYADSIVVADFQDVAAIQEKYEVPARKIRTIADENFLSGDIVLSPKFVAGLIHRLTNPPEIPFCSAKASTAFEGELKG